MDIPPIYKRVGFEIAKKRKQLGITQHGLSGAIGISRAAVANIERGEQRVFFDQLLQICAFLGLDSIDLLLRTGQDHFNSGTHGSSKHLSGAALNRRQKGEIRQILSELEDVR